MIIEHRPVLTLTQKGFEIIRIVCGVYGSEEYEVNDIGALSKRDGLFGLSFVGLYCQL